MDSFEERQKGLKSPLARKFVPIAARYARFDQTTGEPRLRPWDPDVRGWIHKAFPKDGEDARRDRAVDLVDQQLLAAFTPDRVRVPQILAATSVPSLLYISCLPSMGPDLGFPSGPEIGR
jgi:hypothetical protein